MQTDALPKVVIVGAGFGGLYAARTLMRTPVDVLVIDRHNFHTFTPLLYQVATCGLDPGEIAYPVRGIFRDVPNIHFRLAKVVGIDTDSKHVNVIADGQALYEPYDYLIVAAGTVTSYFGNESAKEHGFGLKEVSEAVRVRNHILKMFERASWTKDRSAREAMTTMVVIGGGPTGLEMAGALVELYQRVLQNEYEFLKRLEPRVILVEALESLLLPFPKGLQKSALEQAKSLGIEVILNNPVVEVTENRVLLKDGRVLPTHTLIWAAGVKASPVAEMLGVELAKGGRVPVSPTLTASDLDDVYVVGDMAFLEDGNGDPYPQLIPVAKQQGILAANNILRRIHNEPEQSFRYHDRGIMATIGRSRAVAWIFNRIPVTGFLAWLAWLGLHLVALIGFRNRLQVLVNWAWNYFNYRGGAPIRIILEMPPSLQSIPSQTPKASRHDAAPKSEPEAVVEPANAERSR